MSATRLPRGARSNGQVDSSSPPPPVGHRRVSHPRQPPVGTVRKGRHGAGKSLRLCRTGSDLLGPLLHVRSRMGHAGPGLRAGQTFGSPGCRPDRSGKRLTGLGDSDSHQPLPYRLRSDSQLWSTPSPFFPLLPSAPLPSWHRLNRVNTLHFRATKSYSAPPRGVAWKLESRCKCRPEANAETHLFYFTPFSSSFCGPIFTLKLIVVGHQCR